MKRIAIALAVALALTAAMPAFATEVIMKDGKLTGTYSFTNGDIANASKNTSASVSLATKGSGDGWTAEAELGKLVGGSIGLGAYKVGFNDELVNLMIWGKGKQTSDMNDPFSFVKSAKKHTGDMKVRTTVGPVTVDFEDDSDLYVFANKTIADHKLGIALHSDLPTKNGITAVAHDTTEIAGVKLQGAVGMKLQENAQDNLGYGITAETKVPVLPSVTAKASYKSQPVGFNGTDRNELKVEGVHSADGLTLDAAYTNKTVASTGNLDQNVIAGGATWQNLAKVDGSYTVKGNQDKVVSTTANWRADAGNQKWDDQFKTDKNQYTKNVAPAVQANVTRNIAANNDVDTKLTVKGTMPVLPGQLWVLGSVVSDLEEKTQAVAANGYFQATEKLAIEPSMSLDSAKKMNVGTKATYQMSKNGKLWAGYGMDGQDGQKTGDKVDFGYEVKF